MSSKERRRLRPDDFTVGWITALPIELSAAAVILDEEFDQIDSNRSTTSIYTFGRVGHHNVVLASLPAGQTGTNSAASIASQLCADFKSIEFGLLVGIGGGVPSDTSDVRLGDVVVSQPYLHYGGVVQYDFGKTGTDGRLTKTGLLNKPPQILLQALSKLKANHYRGRSTLESHLAAYSGYSNFDRRSAGPDVLFESTYSHTGGRNCDMCTHERAIKRPESPNRGVKIHYGTIASGNQVMKDGVTRDRISADFDGVLCFEMEAAGLMNNFPCLVIRGICDYADSHKNKSWHGYASATAAALAKEILSIIPNVRAPQEDITSTPAEQQDVALAAARRLQFIESLKFEQIDARQATIKNAHVKTCKWLLRRIEYHDWHNVHKLLQHHGFLWIKGKPGTGKSTLMKYAHKNAAQRMNDTIVISFFFNARGEGLEKSVEGMYRSLLSQLFVKIPALQVKHDWFHAKTSSDQDLRIWSVDALQSIFQTTVEALGQQSLTCFIDALDECEEHQIRNMVHFFEELGETAINCQARFYVCFSSRHYPHIAVKKSIELVLEHQDGHQQDIANYLDSELRPSKHLDRIKTEVLERASGVFLWVVLVVQILNQEYDGGRIHTLQKRLREIPDGLHELFMDILTRDNNNIEDLIICIQLVLFARRPLKREELYFAILAGLEMGVEPWDPKEISFEIMENYLLSSSKGLIETTKSKSQTVQFIHESVRDFLLKEDGLNTLLTSAGSFTVSKDLRGISHEQLKNCCYHYLIASSSMAPLRSTKSPVQSPQEDNPFHESPNQQLPFLEYAVHNVLQHADAAQAHDLPQSAFLTNFDLRGYITLLNLHQKYKRRRYTQAVSLLYICAERDLGNLIRLVMKHDPDIRIKGGRHGSPLAAAAFNTKKAAVQALLEMRNGADDHALSQNVQDRKEAILYLMKQLKPARVVNHDHAAIILLLLGDHAAAILDEPTRDRLFWWSIERGYITIVALMIERDCDVNVCPPDSTPDSMETALGQAIHYGHVEISTLLVHRGADVNVQGRKYGNALQLAAFFDRESVVHVLLNKGADVNVQGGQYGNALQAAAFCSRESVVQMLLNKGADVNAQGGRYGSALQAAAATGCENVVQMLLNKGADVNAQGGRYGSALQAAAATGCENVVQMLLNKGADINAQGGRYSNALRAAALRGHESMVRMLRDAGAVQYRIRTL